MKTWTVAVLGLLGALPAAAAELSVPHEHYQLDNGLDVVLIEDHSAPVVHVNVWYGVGARDEEPGRTGFAHLFEHMMFQGSPSQPGEYFTPLEAVGADINGTTSTDRTNYYETVPAQFLPLALFLESDRMGWLLEELDEEMLANQKEVVRNERRQRVENPPYGRWFIDLYAAMYPKGHPYHHPTIGSHEDLDNATLADVRAFFERWYVPNNASLVVCGDFDPQTARNLIDTYFADIAAGEPPPPVELAPASLDQKVVIEQYQDVPEQRVWMAWHAPALFEPGDAELDLMSSSLSGGKDSRLYAKLVQELGVARSISAAQYSRPLASIYVISAVAAEGHDTAEVVAAVDEVLANVLGDDPPTAEDLDSARANYEAGFYHRIETIAGRADLVNLYNTWTGEPDGMQADLQRYLDADLDGVLDWSRKVLQGNRVELHIRPEAARPAPETELVGDKKRKKKKKKKGNKKDKGGTP